MAAKQVEVTGVGKGWWSEVSPMWPGQAQSLEVDEVLWDEKSEFQHVFVFKNKGPWGTVFALDGAIQVTDKDEFSYHEMMAHIPLFAHPDPRRVLIIGGGDGGVMREVLRHPSVEKVTLCDIDAMVPEISKKFYPQISCSFADPRADARVGDGFKFLEDKKEEFDVIICDSSDPEGPASTLFGRDFYERCRAALRPGGLLVTQGESYWIHLNLIKEMINFIRDLGFGNVDYCNISMPTYPCGNIGFFVCSDGRSGAEPCREPAADVQEQLKMYSPAIHRQSFVLPPFVARELAPPAK
eukprot:TRINITY_DN2583_c0_g1_i1.p2 TRINITY_DN2583_c0_g1~~TRINITY_DN2583_c0_g1_i1.p2  ORF type:complete len:318 (+),score=129.82 TRINITY_DN2583_c0_g1_i1:66-956(+)